MKKIVLLSLMLILSLSIFAQKTEFVYNFEVPAVKNVGDYQILELPNSQQLAKVGEPVLPFVAVKLLLPPETSAKKIIYVFEDKIKLQGIYKLYPKQDIRPICFGNSGNFKVNEEVYLETEYPKIKYNEVFTQFMNGYGFAMSSFTPFEYNPSTGEVFMYKKVSVIVKNQRDSKNSISNISSRSEVINRVHDFAQNPEVIEQYPQKKSDDNYEMLIVTTSLYSDDYADLIEFHLERGIRANVVTLSEIYSQMTGVDEQEKIRNYIIQEYQNHDIQYVLIGGDADVVPYRSLYCEALSGGSVYSDNLPADLYFSALDGTWNDDGDSQWGEPDEADLLPEIAVARLPFSNASELANIINKIISYSNNPVTETGELNDPLLAGEDLYDDPQTWGADYLDLIIGYQNENGYITDGINTAYTTMYARDGSWSGDGSAIIAEMNTGHSFIHHVGHANSGFMMGLYTSDITNSNFSQLNGTTHNYTLVYSHGCICGAFDDDDCISETMVTIENCAVGVFTNSRYGWFNEGQTEGPSAHLHREFTNALYHDKENHAGFAEMISKYETAPWVGLAGEYEPGAQRWVFYDNNALTDPALPIWTANPFEISATYNTDVQLGADFAVTVSSAKGTLENYTCVILQNGKYIGKGVTNSAGQTTIFIDTETAEPGDAQLFVSGYNIITHQYSVNITEATTAVLSMSDYSFSDDNNNIPDYDEQLYVDVKIKNYGQEDATNVKLVLSCEDENISILNGTHSLGTVAALDSLLSTNILQIETDFVDDQYSANLTLAISSDQYSSTLSIPITINAPELDYVSVDITEVTGNGNGIVEAGETGNISFNFSNVGHAISPEISGLLTSDDVNVSIVSESQNIGEINSNNDFSVSSDFTLDASLSNGDLIPISCELQALFYSQVVDIDFYVGDVTEDFETGDFSKFDWTLEGNADWYVESSNVYQGAFSAVSGDIDDNQVSTLKVTADILYDGEISFFKKVSTEENWDYLKFYIDGTEIDKWSGEDDWTQVQYSVSSGKHTFEWIYDKDEVVSGGSDQVWIDDIIFPPFGSILVIPEKDEPTFSDVKLSVFPVPFTSYVNFRFFTETSEIFKIDIYDMSGRNVFSENQNSVVGQNIFTWNTDEQLNSGIYLYRISIENQMFSGKIIKN